MLPPSQLDRSKKSARRRLPRAVGVDASKLRMQCCERAGVSRQRRVAACPGDAGAEEIRVRHGRTRSARAGDCSNADDFEFHGRLTNSLDLSGGKQPHSRVALTRALVAFFPPFSKSPRRFATARCLNYPIIWIDLIFVLQINTPKPRYVTLRRKKPPLVRALSRHANGVRVAGNVKEMCT